MMHIPMEIDMSVIHLLIYTENKILLKEETFFKKQWTREL